MFLVQWSCPVSYPLIRSLRLSRLLEVVHCENLNLSVLCDLCLYFTLISLEWTVNIYLKLYCVVYLCQWCESTLNWKYFEC